MFYNIYPLQNGLPIQHILFLRHRTLLSYNGFLDYLYSKYRTISSCPALFLLICTSPSYSGTTSTTSVPCCLCLAAITLHFKVTDSTPLAYKNRAIFIASGRVPKTKSVVFICSSDAISLPPDVERD